jgi:hypothetical protein
MSHDWRTARLPWLAVTGGCDVDLVEYGAGAERLAVRAVFRDDELRLDDRRAERRSFDFVRNLRRDERQQAVGRCIAWATASVTT